MKNKKHSNTNMPVLDQASGLNQTCNGQNKSKKKKCRKPNRKNETLQNKINESKSNHTKTTEEVGDVKTEIEKSENSTVYYISAGEDSISKDSQTNDILASDASNKHSDSTFSSLSVSPANSVTDYIDDKTFENTCDVELSSGKTESGAVEEITTKLEKFEFSSPSAIKEFIPKSSSEPLSIDVGILSPINYNAVMMGYCDMPTNYVCDSDSSNTVEAGSPNDCSDSKPESPVDSEDSGIAPSVTQDFACVGQESPLQDKKIFYSFEVCARAVGRLIGKRGKFVNFILEQTGAVVVVVDHPASFDDKLCNVHGTASQVSAALDLITERFPQDKYRGFTIERYTYPPLTIQFPESFRLRLPEGVVCELQVCKIINPGHFFVHIPTHPSYFTMWRMLYKMKTFYNEHSPRLECPQLGNVCVILNKYGWCRAEVIQMLTDLDQCIVRLCDLGGYEQVSTSSLYLIHGQFMDYPFQAIQCSLADVEPADGENWTIESKGMLEGMVGGIIYGLSIGCSDTGSFALRLHKKITDYQYLSINQHLLDYGLARPISPPSSLQLQ